jgi:hypothetical protein
VYNQVRKAWLPKMQMEKVKEGIPVLKMKEPNYDLLKKHNLKLLFII